MSRFVAISPMIGAEGWYRAFSDSGYYENVEVGGPNETRLEHPDGSCARIFAGEDGYVRCYIYPPGGTDHPTGRMIVPDIFGKHSGHDQEPEKDAETTDRDADEAEE